jgi:ligand-binding sensor domain-containing protein
MKRLSILSLRVALAAGIGLAVLAGVSAVWRGTRAVRTATHDVREAHEFRFSVQPLTMPANPGFEVISSPQIFVAAAQFQEHLFVAGPIGLVEFNPHGALLHQYAAGTELPGSPLVALCPAVLADSGEPELILATADSGLLAFNGRTFRQIVPASAEARTVTAILPSSAGHLLIGTKKRGVLVYDGKRITVLHPMLDSVYVTSLAGNESDLWVGTLNRGILHLHGGAVESFTDAEGLPDPQVLSLAIAKNITYVGTPTGVAVFDEGRFSRVLAGGIFASALLATSKQLYVGSEDEGVLVISLAGRRPNASLAHSTELSEVRQIFTSGDATFALARGGLYGMSAHGLGWGRVLQSGPAVLSDRNISALAADRNGQLWIGYFDRGLDLLASDSGSAKHVEDEHVFCVNRILANQKTGTVDVATANGLVRFDSTGNEQQVLTRTDGLLADHVTDVAAYRDGLALATPSGLTFLDASGARSMYAFHGLVNNHVYALGVSGDELMAGTLGGLSQLHQGDVRINYTTTTSNLKHNWITSVVPVGSEWMVGTYGAGVVGLDSSGKFHPYEIASAPIEINPNAMLVTDDYVLAGSLGNGLYVYSRQSGRWSIIRDGLPSLNVTAFTSFNGYIYVGTDNGLVRIPEQKLRP